MQEERIPLNTDNGADLEQSGEFDYKNLIHIEKCDLGCIVCFKTDDEIAEKYGCVQCSQCRLCKDCAVKIVTCSKNKKLKNKCPVCSKTKGLCKNSKTNEILMPVKRKDNDIENQMSVTIERRQIVPTRRPNHDDIKVICCILCTMLSFFLLYMFYLDNDEMLGDNRENNQ